MWAELLEPLAKLAAAVGLTAYVVKLVRADEQSDLAAQAAAKARKARKQLERLGPRIAKAERRRKKA